MRSYVEASKFPIVEIAGTKIPRIILGQHPYDGTTYTSSERDQEYRKRWNGPQSMVEMMKPIIQRFGLTASREVPTDNELSRWHQDALRMTMEELNVEIALILGTALPTSRRPQTAEYLYRLSYELAGEEFSKTWRNDPITRYRLERRKGSEEDLDRFARKGMKTPLTPPTEWSSIEVDYEKLDAMLDRYKDFNVPIFASNAAFEFLILAKRYDELQRVVKHVKERFGVFLLGTHYAGIIIPLVEEAGIDVDGYLTPINADGIHMFPTQKHAIEAICNTGKPVIAIKPLGGGRVQPKKAFRYLFHKLNIQATMVGIGNMEEAEETFASAVEALKT
ncbi:hypothetical protein DRO66_01520 [Candidatus Bathyarchaeota archaeon]|nr:MAG: hypothetical protein DRO66_01520 [Candidatus Bathyarchaeota archaeon]